MRTETKWGMELIMDIHGCDSERFKEESLRSFFQGLCDISEMTAVGEPIFWHCESDMPHLGGTSALQFIITSSILIHTVDMMNDAYINFFSCKDFNIQKVIVFIINHFKVDSYHYTSLKRGHHRDKSNRETEIEIRFINQDEARYDTWGDYFIENDKIIFQIVREQKEFYTRLTLIHEMIEYFLLLEQGIEESLVSKFDIDFMNDKVREEKYFEPGNDPSCFYKKEHDFAEDVSKGMCKFLKIDYDKYNLGIWIPEGR